MTKQTIAVVIASLDPDNFLFENLGSVLLQKIPPGWDFHVVVVANGGPEASALICEKFSVPNDNHSPVILSSKTTLVRTGKSTPGSAWNAGARWAIDHQHANWLLFLNSADHLAEEAFVHFARRVESQPEPELAAVYGNLRTWDGSRYRGCSDHFARAAEGDLSEWVLGGPMLPLGVTLIPVSQFRTIGGFSEIPELNGQEDWVFLTRLAFSGHIFHVPQLIGGYRRHSQNPAWFPSLQSVDCAVEQLIPFVREHFKNSPEIAVKKIKFNATLVKIRALSHRGQYRDAAGLLSHTIWQEVRILTDVRTYQIAYDVLSTVALKLLRPAITDLARREVR